MTDQSMRTKSEDEEVFLRFLQSSRFDLLLISLHLLSRLEDPEEWVEEEPLRLLLLLLDALEFLRLLQSSLLDLLLISLQFSSAEEEELLSPRRNP